MGHGAPAGAAGDSSTGKALDPAPARLNNDKPPEELTEEPMDENERRETPAPTGEDRGEIRPKPAADWEGYNLELLSDLLDCG